MSMKKKLRRAFRSVTPNVLDKVTQSAPMQPQPKKSEPAVPVYERKSKIPYWLRETVATAAAFALLVGLVGGGVRYARDRQNSGIGVSTEPSATSPVLPDPPVDPDMPWMWEITCQDTALALACVDPDTRLFTNSNGDTYPVSVTAISNADTYTVKVDSEYTYLFNFSLPQSDYGGSLYSIGIPLTDSVKTGYITEAVAGQIAVLDLKATAGALSYIVSSVNLVLPGDNEDGEPVYEVVVLCGWSGIACTYTYTIHATTGTIISAEKNDTQTGDWEQPYELAYEQARDIALEYLQLELEDLCHLEITQTDDGAYSVYMETPDKITLKVTPDGVEHATIVPATDPDYLSQDGHIGWRAAVDIALDYGVSYARFDPGSLIYLNCELVTDAYGCTYYRIEFSFSILVSDLDSNFYPSSLGSYRFLQFVTAKGGEIYNESTSGSVGYTRAIITAKEAQERVLNALSLTEYQGEASDFSCELVYGGGIREGDARLYYEIMLTMGQSFYLGRVDAFTGEISDIVTSDPVAPAGRISEEYAISQALDAMDFSPEEAFILEAAEVVSDTEAVYRVRFFAAGCEYTVDVGLYGSGYIRHTAADLYDEMENLQALLGKPSTLNHLSWTSYNTALCCLYDSPADLSLYTLFYNGFDDGVPLTEEETAALKDVLTLELDVFRLPASKMDDYLQTYFGVSLEDLDEDCFTGLYYLESTDCYYMEHGDFVLATELAFLAMSQNADGTLSLYYVPHYCFGLDSAYEYCILTVKPLGGENYMIVSNIAK